MALLLLAPAMASAQPQLAALEPDSSGMRTANGTPMQAFALPGGSRRRWLLFDPTSHNSEIFVFDGRRSVSLGEGTPIGVPGLGTLIQTIDERGGGRGRLTLWGIHPTRPRLVEIFHGSIGARPRVLGQSNGEIVIADAYGGGTMHWTIWLVRPGGRWRIVQVNGDFLLDGADVVRGTKVLALPARSTGDRGPLAILDLVTRRITTIGTIRGCREPLYTGHGGERLAFRAMWSDSPFPPQECTARVDAQRLVLLP